jgi:hypothetical protein
MERTLFNVVVTSKSELLRKVLLMYVSNEDHAPLLEPEDFALVLQVDDLEAFLDPVQPVGRRPSPRHHGGRGDDPGCCIRRRRRR